jgi:hypothetical protein
MGQEEKLQKIDRDKLPLLYRLILKIPMPAISSSVDIPSGIFYAIILPIFLFLDFFLNIYFLISFSFPVNVLLFLAIPFATLMVFIRVNADRFINLWNSSVVGGFTPREVKEVLKEYLAMRGNKPKDETKTE